MNLQRYPHQLRWINAHIVLADKRMNARGIARNL
jgi:hypothetical protein